MTFCDATAGCDGVVSAENSLVGSTAGDLIGAVTALPNGNYVVMSHRWDATTPPTARDVGSVTLCDGTSGCSGEISPASSLVGSKADDHVGSFGITLLTNGNFVVNSPNWDSTVTDAGAVTFCDGTTGCAGEINSSNSLLGTTAFDNVGNAGTSSQLLNPVTVPS